MIQQFNYDAFDSIGKLKADITIAIGDTYHRHVIEKCRTVINDRATNSTVVLNTVTLCSKNIFTDQFRFKSYMKKQYPDLDNIF